MRYLFLIYSDHTNGGNVRSEAENEALIDAYNAFTHDVVDRGIARGGAELEGVGLAKTVRVRNGETIATDGPYAETKEQLGGYYDLECANLDEAITLAERIPSATYGSIEIRPVVG